MNALRSVQHASDFLARSAAPVDPDGAAFAAPLLARDIADLEQEVARGPAVDLATDLPAYIDAVKHFAGPGIDDRKFLLEKLVTLMSRLPDDSVFAARLQEVFLDILYKDLPHPPASYLSLPHTQLPATGAAPPKALTYAFRPADGSNYNPLLPTLGMAGTPYARSVPSTHPAARLALPDAGLVFDTLLKRDHFVPHPAGISSLFFAFADIIIHNIFNTNPADWTINNNSSYLDLAPLYGNSDAELDTVRNKDGFGKLWPDVFADSRLMFMPPPVCALLVLFNRNHNYIADTLFRINEPGTFADPATLPDAARAAQDAELFARARLVNTCFFMQAILGDYVGAILGLVRDGSAWRLNPLEAMREADHAVAPRGEGNVVSVEFNLLYRWHATTAQEDERWLDGLFAKVFDGKAFSQLTTKDFGAAVRKYVGGANPDVREWTFDSLKRGPDGKFSDDDLARILQNATEAPASAFKARGIPEALRVVEVLGIEQARAWGVCTLNEFRSFMGLRPYASFEEWNPDPAIAKAAEALYHHIDNLELHVGMQAEEAKVPMPGAGLCPGYTISRAILADAVCLTRGDRFLTVDFTPFNLTSWGYQDVMYDRQDGSYGGMLTKMLFRTLPKHYPAGSAYAHFPFMVPARMKADMERLPDSPVDLYDWARPQRVDVAVAAAPGVAQLALAAPALEPLSRVKVDRLFEGVLVDRKHVHDVLFADATIKEAAADFAKIAEDLIASKSIPHVGSPDKYVDVVRDVVNLVPVYWLSDKILGLPLKTAANPAGEFRDHDLASQFEDVANYVYAESSPEHDFTLRTRATQTAQRVSGYIKGHFAKLTHGLLSPSGFTDTVKHWIAGGNDHSDPFLRALLGAAHGTAHDALAAGLFEETVVTAALYSKAVTHVVDYWIEDSRRAGFVKVLAGGDEAAIVNCIREALGAYPPLAGVFGVAQSDVTINGLGKVQAGNEVFIPLSALENPRPLGPINWLFFEKTAPQILKVVFALHSVQRAPGQSGELTRLSSTLYGAPDFSYVTPTGEVSPWPVSLTIQYQN